MNSFSSPGSQGYKIISSTVNRKSVIAIYCGK